MNNNIPVLPSGLTTTIVRHVTPDTLADRAGNPTPAHVLATPTLVAWFESCLSAAMLPCLDPALVILGAHIEIHHRRPTPPGHVVHITATLVEQTGNKTTWHVVADDEVERVADGTVVSALADAALFTERLDRKKRTWLS